MKDLVTRAISGHATETMQRHYSTVQQAEIRGGLAKVIELAGYRQFSVIASEPEPESAEGKGAEASGTGQDGSGRSVGPTRSGGVQGGVRGADEEKAG